MNRAGLLIVCAVLARTRADDTVIADRTSDPIAFRNVPEIGSSKGGSASNLTECANRTADLWGKDVEERRVYDVLALWDNFPKVISLRGGSDRCRNETALYLNSLHNFDLWAVKMFDATAKLPSGILSGNINQYGDFDECLSVGDSGDEVKGQYCLASIQLKHTLAHVDSMLHAHHYMRSNVTDMGHRVPRFSSIVWGVCIPSSCSSQDLEEELALLLEGTGAQVKVHDTMCTIKGRRTAPPVGKFLALTLFLGILLLVAMGTIFDDGSEGATPFLKVLNAFSLRRNAKTLFDVKESPREISGVSGSRCLHAIALLMTHKSMALTHAPFVNRTQMAEFLSEPWTVIGRASIIYTDSFFYMSGLLNAHNLFQELNKKGTIDFKSRLISRWFRLFPLFLSVMVFCTYVLPDLSSGPQWNLVVEEHSRVCQRTMWRSLLFIHNFFGFENMCLTHTHQIGIDMQLYVVTPMFVWLMWRLPRLGWLVLLASALGSAVLRYLAVYRHNISMVVYFGISVQNLLDAAKYSYILPTHRASIYLIGVGMACFLLSKRSKFQISKAQVALLWTTALSLGCWALFSPWWMGLKSYTYEHGPAAVYATFSPFAWGGFLALGHWAICNGYGGAFTSLLNSRAFRFLNKISYGVYLTQFPLYFYNLGVQRYSDFYTSLHIFYLPEIAVIVGLSIITTLTIEMPFNEIYRKFFSKSKVPNDKVKVK